MENTNIAQPKIGYSNTQPNDIMKNMIIIILAVVLIFSLLGVNIFISVGNFMQQIIDIFNPLIQKTLSELGFASGSLINTSADTVSTISKSGVDIANGTLHQVGDLLKKASKHDLDQSINNRSNTQPEVKPDNANSNIQESTTKSQWCLVGEYQGRRGCVEIGKSDKCLSGQVFPNQKMCLNPTLSQNKMP
jgi:hypothetical protein